MKDFESSGKTKFDLRQSQLQHIGTMNRKKAEIYFQARQSVTSGGDIHPGDIVTTYMNILKTLYRTLRVYSDNSEKKKSVKDKISSAEKLLKDYNGRPLIQNIGDSGKPPITRDAYQEPMNILEEAEDLIDEIRVESGLDIPQEVQVEEGEEWQN